LPLDLHLTAEYGIAQGSETIDERRCYVVSFEPPDREARYRAEYG
jgi:hypothetical protein